MTASPSGKQYVFLTNIPAPYRVAMYNELARAGFNFEVFYMRATEEGRSWKSSVGTMQHRYYIDRGWYKSFGYYHLHINPRLIFKLLTRRSADIIIGGGWNDIDVLALAALKRLHIIPNRLHFWTEANYLTIGARRDNPIKQFLRRFVFNASHDAQISSGKMTEMTLQRWGIKSRKYVPLPNTIDEAALSIAPDQLAARWANPMPTLLIPARLTEQIKGVLNFFRAIGDENIRRAHFLLAGDGPDEDMVRAFVRTHQLEDHIQLLGFCEPDRLLDVYARAQAVILPSFSDASPLTLVEALRMHLPILASERCGNHYETVQPGINGYLFDPDAAPTIRSAFEQLMARRAEWPAMGEVSAQLYGETFDRATVINRFMTALDALDDGAR